MKLQLSPDPVFHFELLRILGLARELGADIGEALDALAKLADLLVLSVQEWIKALYHASHLERRAGYSAQPDASDFLTAIDRVFEFEHQADNAERALTYAAVQHAPDFRQLHLYAEMGRSLEAASDALKSAGVIARDYLIGSVLRA